MIADMIIGDEEDDQSEGEAVLNNKTRYTWPEFTSAHEVHQDRQTEHTNSFVIFPQLIGIYPRALNTCHNSTERTKLD